MDLSTNIINNYKTDYNLLMKTIEERLEGPEARATNKTPDGKAFHGFSFTTNKSHRYILPVIKDKMLKAGHKDVKWDFFEKRNITYVYLFI